MNKSRGRRARMHATTRHDRVTRVTLLDCSCQHNCSHVTVRHLRRSSEVQQPRTPQPRSPGGVHTAAAVARPEGNSHMVNEVIPALRRVPARQQGTSTSAPAPAPCSKTTQMGMKCTCARVNEKESEGGGREGKHRHPRWMPHGLAWKLHAQKWVFVGAGWTATGTERGHIRPIMRQVVRPLEHVLSRTTVTAGMSA